MGLVHRSLALGCMAIILVLQMAMARYPNWMLNGKAQVFADLSAQEMEAVHSFLMSRTDLDLHPYGTQALDKNSVFLIEMLLPKKKDVLEFLEKGAKPPVREARVIIIFSAQEYPNVTEFAVGPLPQPDYMRELSPGPKKDLSWSSRPMFKAELRLVYHKIKEFIKPLKKFILDITGYSLEDCYGRCLTFTHMSPRSPESTFRATWFALKRIVNNRLEPTGLEIAVDHGSPDVRKWYLLDVKYNSVHYMFAYNLAQRYADGLVDIGVLKDRLPVRKIPKPLSRSGQGNGPKYSLEGNAVIYKRWSFSFRLRPSSGLQILNVHFRNESIAYEISIQSVLTVQEQHVVYKGDMFKPMEVGWDLGSVPHELSPGIDCPESATFLDVIHYYDTDEPVRRPRALCIFEIPTGVPVSPTFNISHKTNLSSGGVGHKMVLRAKTTQYSYDYIWDFIFYDSGMLSAQMHVTGYVHTFIYTPEGLKETHLVTNLVDKNHSHFAHYRVDLDVAGTNNSFHALQTRQNTTTNPSQPRYSPDAMEETRYSHESQATFPLEQALPPFLFFSSPKKDKWGRRRSYHLKIDSTSNQGLTPNTAEDLAYSWARYSLAVTKYRESEQHSTSLYNQNHLWQPVLIFQDFLKDNDNIEDQDLVAWVTVGFSHGPPAAPYMTSLRHSVGFFLMPTNFFAVKHRGPRDTDTSNTESLETGSA